MDQSTAVPHGETRTLAWRSALAALCLAAAAHAQDMLWITQLGTSGYEFAAALASDNAGGTFMAGGTTGSFGGPNQGKYDFRLARYDTSGNQTWIAQAGSSLNEWANSLAPDDAGGTFVAGVTHGSFGGPNQGGDDAWLARYDASGHQIWITQLGTSAYEEAAALAPDGSGGAFIVGYTKGSLGGPHQGDRDAWLARFDAAGKEIWITQLGTKFEDFAKAVASDGVGGAFVAGATDGSLGGPYHGDCNNEYGCDDAWLARYDPSGNQIWITQLGTKGYEAADALAFDGAGGTFVAGVTEGSLGGPNRGLGDAWIAHYDASGDQDWISQLGTIHSDAAGALATDGTGGTFIAGLTQGSLGGPYQGTGDAWIARYDGAGEQTWITQLGTSDSDGAFALAPDEAGGAYVAGSTFGSLGGSPQGAGDAWLAHFSGVDQPGCYPDFDGNGSLDLFDFLKYVNSFNHQEPRADCDGNGTLDLFDFLCFVNAFNVGC